VLVSVPTSTKHFKTLAPLLVAPVALLLYPGRAEAILTYNIFEDGPNVVIQTSGSLSLGTQLFQIGCSPEGIIVSNTVLLCTGLPSQANPVYRVSGPTSFNGSVSAIGASSVSGIATILTPTSFALRAPYINNTPIISSATFNNATLAGLGFTTTTGLLGTWQLTDTPGPSGQINLVLGPPAAVPGPLPLLGAAAAFGWSRRLRRRIATAKITPED
jgi:hypothetical protein